jgi:hypothetical protein
MKDTETWVVRVEYESHYILAYKTHTCHPHKFITSWLLSNIPLACYICCTPHPLWFDQLTKVWQLAYAVDRLAVSCRPTAITSILTHSTACRSFKPCT